MIRDIGSGRTIACFMPVGSSKMLQDPALIKDPMYWLPQEPLARLGAIQVGPVECGDMCVYSAAVAKGILEV